MLCVACWGMLCCLRGVSGIQLTAASTMYLGPWQLCIPQNAFYKATAVASQTRQKPSKNQSTLAPAPALHRFLQSVQKKATLQFKSLDATLQTYNKDTNKKEAITYRCADINAMVPMLMGVSKVGPLGLLPPGGSLCLQRCLSRHEPGKTLGTAL